MTYAVRDDLLARFGDEIAELERVEGKEGLETVGAALEDATGEIDGHLAPRYRLPLPAGRTWPALRWICCDVARYRLWEARVDDMEENAVYVRYKKAAAFLAKLASGEVGLVDAAGEAAPPSAALESASVATRRRPVFTGGVLRRMDYGS